MNIPYRFKLNTSSFAYYWTEGLGKELLNKLGRTPDIDQAKQFIPLLYQWDNKADEIIQDLYAKIGILAANKSLFNYIDEQPLASDESTVWNNFFKDIDLNPDWLDWNKIQKGSELCRRPGLTSLIVLRDYCLMGGYESAAINKPLIYTGALKKGAVKRLVDTVEFWVQITKENGLQKGSEGLKQVFLTRMIHAYSRVHILQKSDWDTEKWGVPINSWDMLATNLGFSLVFMVGLHRMGIQVSPEEKEGVFHFWKYIGYLLGIPLELLPDNEEEAIEALYYWTMTQREGDADTQLLASALKEEPVMAHYPANPIMRKMMREIHLFYNHYLLGEYSCRLLGLPSTTIGRFGIINVWRTKKQEMKIGNEANRQKAILDGGNEQENVRQIYQKYNR